MKRYQAQILLLAALVISFVISRFSDQFDSYYLDIALTAGISIVLAVSLNLVNGHTGQFSLGHAGLMAVGAYGSAVVSLELGPGLAGIFGTGEFGQGMAFITALLTGGVLAAAFGWMIGVPSLRLRGDYLAIVTLGFNEIIRVILQNTKPGSVFGGALGLSGIPSQATIFWVFGAAAVCVYVVTSMVNSTWGRGFLAVRDDEVAASASGISTTRY
ncbi:MAG: branched-chain amino acid ABC transporter permease, partial [Verrucomicrobiaceae bacterium]